MEYFPSLTVSKVDHNRNGSVVFALNSPTFPPKETHEPTPASCGTGLHTTHAAPIHLRPITPTHPRKTHALRYTAYAKEFRLPHEHHATAPLLKNLIWTQPANGQTTSNGFA